ncbi:hypothetical protein [Zunongwangia atlantica]|uniref:Uncharacterized protein n=1 Tax=Zunongwangia atlantica 22II14-10F7 TaxID=1185767 RepID=A0A1Y1SZ75_9FLAO|nr:hypothetical protein [Zunongwangia atlantica]ORL44057.1 hypothetical protein IIF7_17737 [Zunongwangia atlantica 22II14-10F7]
MNKESLSKKLSTVSNGLNNKFKDTTKKVKESNNFKKVVGDVKTTSSQLTILTKNTSSNVISTSKKVIESDQLKRGVQNVGNLSKQAFVESKKVAYDIASNIALVAAAFFALNLIYILYALSNMFSDFQGSDILVFLLALGVAIVFSIKVGIRSYKYARFKIGMSVFFILESFFKELISESLRNIENLGTESLKKNNIYSILKMDSNKIIENYKIKVPWILRQSISFLIEFIPLATIIMEIKENAKDNSKKSLESKTISRLNSFVRNVEPQKKFTSFMAISFIANIIVMSILMSWL